MQKTSTDMCMYYDGQIASTYCGLFDFTSHDVYKAYYAFYGFNKLYQLGREVFSCAEGENLYVCGAKGQSRCGLLMVNRNTEHTEINLELKGAELSSGECWAIDQEHAFEKIPLSMEGKKVTMPADGVWYLEFQAE